MLKALSVARISIYGRISDFATWAVFFYADSEVRSRLFGRRNLVYVTHCHPMDKAGAYGVQEWIGYIGVEYISGSYFNVMGLPIQRLYAELKEFI